MLANVAEGQSDCPSREYERVDHKIQSIVEGRLVLVDFMMEYCLRRETVLANGPSKWGLGIYSQVATEVSGSKLRMTLAISSPFVTGSVGQGLISAPSFSPMNEKLGDGVARIWEKSCTIKGG